MDKLQQFIEKLNLQIEMCFVVNGVVEYILIKGSNSDCFSVYTNRSYNLTITNAPNFPVANIVELKDLKEDFESVEQSMYESIIPRQENEFLNSETLEQKYTSRLQPTPRIKDEYKQLLNQVRRLNMCISHTSYRFSVISNGVFAETISGTTRLFKIEDRFLLFLKPSIPISKNQVTHKIIIQTRIDHFYSNGNRVDIEQADIKYKLYEMLQRNFDQMIQGIGQLEEDIEYIKLVASNINTVRLSYLNHSRRFDTINQLIETSRLKSVMKEKEYRSVLIKDSSIDADLIMAEERSKYSDLYNKIKDMKRLVFDTERDLRNRLDEIFIVSDDIGFVTNILTRQISENFKRLSTIL